MLCRATLYRYVLLAAPLAVAGCVQKGAAVYREADDGTSTYGYTGWSAVLWVVISVVVLGIGVLLLAKKGGWSGVMPTIVALGMLALTLVLLNERVVVDDEHVECTSGWITTDTKSVRFSDLDNITIRSETRMTLHGPVTVYSYICNKKGGGQVVFSVTGMMSKAQPQIVTNAQKKGVKLIGFEQLQQ
jgi:hypothetical protein